MVSPMAGGPSTPELVAAAGQAGAFGFLAAGYKSAAAMNAEIAAVRAASGLPFGVNVFVPQESVADPAKVAAYVAALEPDARRAADWPASRCGTTTAGTPRSRACWPIRRPW